MTNPTPLTTRLYRAFKWLLINGLFAYLAYMGIAQGSAGATNVFCFGMWLAGLLAMSAGCYAVIRPDEEAVIKTRDLGRSMPKWLEMTYDVTLGAALVWNGWWWSVIALLMTVAGGALIYHKPPARS